MRLPPLTEFDGMVQVDSLEEAADSALGASSVTPASLTDAATCDRAVDRTHQPCHGASG